MPHRTRPVTGLLLFTGLNFVLLQTITPVYDFVCFHPYWERRRERRRQEREAALANASNSTLKCCVTTSYLYQEKLTSLNVLL